MTDTVLTTNAVQSAGIERRTDIVVDAIRRGCPISVQTTMRWGQWPEIVLGIDGRKFAHVSCLLYSPPNAVADGAKVHVTASDRLPGSFELHCASDEEAEWVAETIEVCLKTGFRELGGVTPLSR